MLTPARRWLVVYIGLAALNLVMLVAITALSQQSVQDATTTLRFDAAQAEVRAAVLAVNAPGNDVFATGLVDVERQRLDQAELAARSALANLRAIDPVSPFPDSIAFELGVMVGVSRELLASFAAGDRAAAGARMAEMDRGLTRIAAYSTRHQAAFGSAATAQVSARQRTMQGVAVVIVALLFFAILYGRLLARHLERTQRQQQDLVTAAEAARARAEASDVAKSQFLATMSHEIRTPLNGVIGLTGLLLEMELSADQREYARQIQHSGNALLAVLNDILDFSKIEAGGLELEVADFELRQALDDALKVMAVSSQQRNVRLVSEFDPALPTTVRGDVVRLRQVVTNLVSNAIKFSEPGGRVWVRAKRWEMADGAPMLRVDVEDRGIGISLEAQQRLFAPFHQVDASTTRKYGGTGLGLAICRRLVALMGGELGVTSEPGVGSTFWFTCPLRPAASAAGATSNQALPLAPASDGTGPSDDGMAADTPRSAPTSHDDPRSALLPAPYPGGREHGQGTVPIGLRVLVAEDESINLMLITAMLQRAGCTVMTARNGIEAVAAAAEWDPDLILMDYHMPRMDGLHATRAIRDAERASPGTRVPIVALTANATAEARQAALAAGMDRFLTKPIVSLALQHCLEAYAPRRRRPQAVDSPAL